MKKIITMGVVGLLALSLVTGCDYVESSSTEDKNNTLNIGNKLSNSQPTPTDIDYSLERYNLIKRAYWVNGMRDKANALQSPIADMPLGYIILFTESGSVVGKFTVDGKVSSLNSYLTPDSEFYECTGDYCNDGALGNNENDWIPDIDGSYGSNDNGIFFFTTDGKYIEWTGTYLYSDIPFKVSDPIVKVGE